MSGPPPVDFEALAAEIAEAVARNEVSDHPAQVISDARLTALALIEGFGLDDEQRQARWTVLTSRVTRNGPEGVAELIHALAALAWSAIRAPADLAVVSAAEQIDHLRGLVIAVAAAEEEIERERTEGDADGGF